MLAASAAFRVLGSSNAADVVGAMLVRWHYIALAAPLLLFILELRRARAAVLIILFCAVLLAVAQGMVDLRLRSIRNHVNVTALDRDDPLRRAFGRLHGVSMVLLLIQTLAAAVVVAAKEKNMSEEREDKTIYKVVVNDEEQYSIWPADRENALGWRDVGKQGTRKEVLAYIEEVWTDMRPLSLRKKMDGDTSGGGP